MASPIAIAHLTRTRGNKGELCAIPLSDHPERFQLLKSVEVAGKPYEVESVWYHKNQPIFKFREINSISEAESLVGGDVCVPASERFALPEGEYYFSDLVGCAMVDAKSNAPIGVVKGWQEAESAGRQIWLEVDTGSGGDPLLVPFVKAILQEIDVAQREIRADLPAGLAEVNE